MKPLRSVESTESSDAHTTGSPTTLESSSSKDSNSDSEGSSRLDSIKQNLSWAKNPKAQAGVATGIGASWMFFLGSIPGTIAFFLFGWLIVSGARADGGFKKNRWILISAIFMLAGAFVPEFTGMPRAFRDLEGTERAVPEVLRDDRGTEEQPPTRGEIVEPVSLPSATQLPMQYTFSSSGTLKVEGGFTIQVQGVGLITFDPATGDRTLPGGKTLNSTPESNQGAFPDPIKSWGVLLVRQNDGEWVHAQGFLIQPGVQYEIALNVNQEYRRYVQYRPGIRINLYSE